MMSGEADGAERGRIGSEPVGHDSSGRKALLLGQLLHEPLGGLGVAPGLNQGVVAHSVCSKRTVGVRAVCCCWMLHAARALCVRFWREMWQFVW